jgi:hypothetical protein
MKTIVYICDVCKKEAQTESEISFFLGNGDQTKGEINGSLLFNEKKVKITINLVIENVEHVCKQCQINIMESFLKKEVVDTYFKNKDI